MLSSAAGKRNSVHHASNCLAVTFSGSAQTGLVYIVLPRIKSKQVLVLHVNSVYIPSHSTCQAV